jgi:serine/threonine-protein kinase
VLRTRALVGLVAVLVLAAAGWATWVYAVPHYTTVPNVVGLTVDRAQARLEDTGLDVAFAGSVFSTSIPSGRVVRSTPPRGARIRKGVEVVLTASKGPELLPVPSVIGADRIEAERSLMRAGFRVKIVEAFSDVPSGRIADQSPEPGQQLVKGNEVEITVSKGPPPVAIPTVAGSPAQAAEARLRGAGFLVVRREEYSIDVPEGLAIGTRPEAGTTIGKGSRVVLIVSRGPRSFPMPRVLGMTEDAAHAALEGNLGLVVRVIELPGSSKRKVVGQDPAPGYIVRQGDTVRIYVGG